MRAPGRRGAKARRVGLKRIRAHDEEGYDQVPTGKVGHGKDLRTRGLYWHNRTESNINVAPLRRMLQTNLGGRWTTIRSALLADVRPRDRAMLERELAWHVAAGAAVVMQDGKPCRKAECRWARGRVEIFERFYEHPVTGLLCARKPTKHVYRKSVDPEEPFEVDGVSYVIKNGLWYRRTVMVPVEPRPSWVWKYETMPVKQETVMLRQISGKERDRLVAKCAV
jgi:hypothetical protein